MADQGQNLSFSYSPPLPGAVASNLSPGSIDAGGPADKVCAAWVGKDTPAGVISKTGLQQWSYENFGVPYYAPSFIDSVRGTTLMVVGAFAAGFHGYQRTGGSVPWMLGWGLLGAFLPLPTLAVAVISGYGQRKGSRRSTRA